MFLQPQTLAALDASQFTYSRSFTIGAAAGGVANSAGSTHIQIQGGKPFFSVRQYISFPTTTTVGATLTDDGVCRLTLLLKSNSSVQLYNTYVRLCLYAVPGRQTVEGAVAPGGGAPSPGRAPHIDGKEWYCFLPGGTEFAHEFLNSSNTQAVVDVAYDGFNIRSDVDTQKKFWDIVKSCQPAPMGF